MFKILVVEDDKDLNQTVCAYLNKNGYEAIGCLSANDAYNEMYGTLLQSPELSEEQRIQYGKAIQEQTKRLSNLVMNILKLNKLENQQIYPNVEKYDLGEQLCECMLEFESVWEEKNMEIDVDIQEEVQIQADKELLSLVWNNLLSNALKFTEADGKVSLLLKGDEKLAYVQIKDTGCGMSAETGKNIFKKLGRFVFCVGDCSWNSWDGCHRDGVSGICKDYKEAAGEAGTENIGAYGGIE